MARRNTNLILHVDLALGVAVHSPHTYKRRYTATLDLVPGQHHPPPMPPLTITEIPSQRIHWYSFFLLVGDVVWR